PYYTTTFLTSTNFPLMAAAAAIAGETKCVRAPLPWRPSKLRLLVDAQCTPAGTWSGFIPRHIEQPGSLHSNPAFLNTLSRPNFSASIFTVLEPGTTIAVILGCTRFPFTIWLASIRSDSRAFVQEPKNTYTKSIYSTFCPAFNPILLYVSSSLTF